MAFKTEINIQPKKTRKSTQSQLRATGERARTSAVWDKVERKHNQKRSDKTIKRENRKEKERSNKG